ncbi:MAG: hypothetical protein AAB965_00320 [Patescibacteria group bacterium]
MESLLSELGINWMLLLSQSVNFLVVLVVLRAFIYKPLLATMKTRREKIEQGLMDADDAKKKLAESEVVKLAKIEEGEKRASIIVEEAGNIAKRHAKAILADADRESESIVAEAEKIGAKKIEAELVAFERKAKELLLEAISSAVAMNPKDIDEKLTVDALSVIKKKSV